VCARPSVVLLQVMLPRFWVVSTKPGAALARVKGSLQPLQGRGWFLAPRDRGPEAGVYCLGEHYAFSASCSFLVASITFWATCDGTSS
jgi:hypothetical protein